MGPKEVLEECRRQAAWRELGPGRRGEWRVSLQPISLPLTDSLKQRNRLVGVFLPWAHPQAGASLTGPGEGHTQTQRSLQNGQLIISARETCRIKFFGLDQGTGRRRPSPTAPLGTPHFLASFLEIQVTFKAWSCRLA